MSTSGCVDNAVPTVGPSPWTRLNTPAGTPACSSTSAKITAFSGATSDGFRTIVQPAASAGATLQAIWLIGQFHGVISAHTPIGSLTSSVVPISCSNWYSASTRRAVMKCPTPAPAWARSAIDSGAPISWLIVSPMSVIRVWYTSMIRSSRASRSSTGVCDHVSNAALAAATAASTSACVPIAIVVIGSSVAGLITARVVSPSGSTHAPSMKNCFA